MIGRGKSRLKRKWLCQAVMDGLLNSFYFIVLQWFVVSVFFDYVAVDERIFVFICLFGVLVNSIVYYKFLHKKESVKEFLGLTSVSALVFIVCMLIRFVFLLTLPIRLFQRELCNADGLLLFFSAIIFLISTIILRLFILIHESNRVSRTMKDKQSM